MAGQEWWTGDRKVHRAGEDREADWFDLVFGGVAMVAAGLVGLALLWLPVGAFIGWVDPAFWSGLAGVVLSYGVILGVFWLALGAVAGLFWLVMWMVNRGR